MLRVTADTNILISALIFPGGKPFQLLELAREGKIDLTVSEAILDEKEDPPDNRILECASAAGSDYIVSGDKDLLRLGRYDSIRIVRVAEFLELAQER